MTRADLQELKKLHEAYAAYHQRATHQPYTAEIRALEEKWSGVDITGMLLDALDKWMPSENDVH